MRNGLVLLLLASLAGCSGSGGNGGPPPPPANSAPTFTSAAAITVPENVTGTVYQAVATDPDGDAITYSISGVDAARFTMTPQGALTFNLAPDFENPGDQNNNNVYQFAITASDGKSPKELSFTLTVTNTADRIGSVRIGTGYVNAVQSVGVPGGDDLLVAQEDGRIYLLDPGTGGTGTLFLTVANVRWLLGIALAPDYPTSGTFYVSLVNTANEVEIRRYRRQNATTGDPASSDTILAYAYQFPPSSSISNYFGGWIGFGPDGDLYVATGDDQSANNAQSLSNLQGKILRVDVRSDAFPADPRRDYAIPADNPFAAGAAPEIYAYGFRNPRRSSFNGPDLLIGDSNAPLLTNGREIDLLRPQDKGRNYGFGATFGTPNIIDSAIVWSGFGPAMGAGTSVTGGRVYRGPVTELVGLYIFYDDAGSRYFSVPATTIRQDVQLTQAGLTLRSDIEIPGSVRVFSIDEDANFNMIFVTATGVYRVEKF